MKQRNNPILVITPKGEIAAKAGHPWVYAEEIIQSVGEFTNGCIVDVLSKKGSYIGSGLYSQESKIRVRLLTRNGNDKVDDAFFVRRLKYAVEYRKNVLTHEDFQACRLIFGEADGLPGLTVDRYSDILVVQVLSFGMDLRKDFLMSSLCEILTGMGEEIHGVYERSDVALRLKEGLEEHTGWMEVCPHGDSTETEMTENHIRYGVDFANGQKTGFFLDQKFNRRAVAELAKGKKVLDCFTHTGSFALNAAYGGAEEVTAVDISASAIEMAKANAVRNGLDSKMNFLCTDVFSLLTDMAQKKTCKYDFIILDPPAFTKSRKTVNAAERGYYEINYLAMKMLPRGGYLATASCSHFMENTLFEKMLKKAAATAEVSLRQVKVMSQSPDHPFLWNVPETAYLKFYLFQII